MPALDSLRAKSIVPKIFDALLVGWENWPRFMELSVLQADAQQFSLIGECPHPDCRAKSVFVIKGQVHSEHAGSYSYYLHAIMQCQGCQKFILGIVFRPQAGNWEYIEHYPLGIPDDSVPPEVRAADEGIAEDFAEACVVCG